MEDIRAYSRWTWWGVINIENWIPKYILGYVLYMAFVVTVVANTTVVNPNIYAITPEQQAIISSPSGDPLTFLVRASILGSISSGYAVLGILTAILTFIFLLALAKAIKEVIPVLPS